MRAAKVSVEQNIVGDGGALYARGGCVDCALCGGLGDVFGLEVGALLGVVGEGVGAGGGGGVGRDGGRVAGGVFGVVELFLVFEAALEAVDAL